MLEAAGTREPLVIEQRKPTDFICGSAYATSLSGSPASRQQRDRLSRTEAAALVSRVAVAPHSVLLQRPDEVRIDEQPVVPTQRLHTGLLGGCRRIECLSARQQQRLQVGFSEAVGALR